MVGISGAAGERAGPHRPMARSAPLFRCGCTAGSATTPISTWPAIMSVTIGPVPL